MSTIEPVKAVAALPLQFTEVVVDAATAATLLTYEATPIETFGTWSDRAVSAELNAISPGLRIERGPTRKGGRAVHMILNTSALLSSAPSAVQTLAATLVPDHPQAYVYSSVAGGDVWIVSQTTEGLRHGGYEFIRAQGVYYLAPDPNWKVRKFSGIVTGGDVLAMRTPSVTSLQFIGNGGFINSPAIPGILTAINWWNDWFAQCRNPREFTGGFGDGDEAFTFYKQHELRYDHNKLAYVPAAPSGSRRGYDIDHNQAYPLVTFAVSTPCFAKVNPTDHGPSGSAWPTAPAGPTPWTAFPSGPTGPAGAPIGTSDAPGDTSPETSADAHPTEFASFGGLVKLHCEFHRDVICQRINTLGVLHPTSRWVSVEGNDGRSDCRCDKCVNLLRSGPYSAYLTPTQQTQDSNISDSVFHLANQNARYLATFFANSVFKAGPGIEAYAAHGTPPSIPLEPNMLVSLLPSASQEGNTLSDAERVAAWATKCATNPLGPFTINIQSSWLLGDTNFDAPRTHPLEFSGLMKLWQSLGYTGLDSQTTYGFAVVGSAFWLIAELAWNPTADLPTLLNQFRTLAFGTVTSQMSAWLDSVYSERMYGDWVSHFEFGYYYVSSSFAALAAITAILTSTPDPDPGVALRVDSYIVWVQWWRLYTEYLAAQRAYHAAANPTTLSAYTTALDNAIRWCWSCVNVNVFHGARMAQKLYLAAVADSVSAIVSAWDVTNYPGASGWSTLTPPTHSSLATLLASGVSAYPPISGIVRRTFSDQLVPFTSTGVTTDVPGMGLQATPHYYIFVKPAGSFNFKVTQTGGWASGATPGLPLPVVLLDLSGNEVMRWNPQALDSSHGAIDTTLNIPSTVAAGTYRLEVRENISSNETSAIKFPNNVPIVLIEPPVQFRGFSTAIHFYFYVPIGTTKVAILFDTLDQPITFYDDTGTAQTTTALSPNMWYVTVPAGHDGKVWSWTGYYSRTNANQPYLLNCPNVYAFDKAQVMVPRGLDGF